MRWVDERLTAWRDRPIPPIYKVVYIDGMHVDVLGGDRDVMLVARRRDDGGLDILGLCLSIGEHCVEPAPDASSTASADGMLPRQTPHRTGHFRTTRPMVQNQTYTQHFTLLVNLDLNHPQFSPVISRRNCLARQIKCDVG